LTSVIDADVSVDDRAGFSATEPDRVLVSSSRDESLSEEEEPSGCDRSGCFALPPAGSSCFENQLRFEMSYEEDNNW
jgi:hypothetical protein